ncbi:MAG: hypothetical protein H6739_20715 [Alphaproteobacteria bacterium]|nr:hypothetical protein [Alphaproteobacteria bacterium]
MLLSLLLFGNTALATVDEACLGLARPDDYDEQTQADFLNNAVALASTLSPLHGPVPHAAGRGSVGLDLAVIPPLGCRHRMVLDWTKSEDTNKSPVLPRPRMTFAFNPIAGRLFPYGGVAFVPPVPVAGVRSVVASVEAGVGVYVGQHAQLGVRVHGTLQTVLGDVATSFEEDGPVVEDLYVATSQGVDVMLGWELERVTPYLALGYADVGTFFWIGDDAYVSNNLHPYLGPAASLGADALLFDRLRLAGELYAAPGGHTTPRDNIESLPGFGRYGHLYTARLRIAYEL